MKLLAESHDGGRWVRVMERQHDGSRLYFEGSVLYTHVDACGANLLRYIDAMDTALGDVSDVLLLGTAGGALATKLSRRGVRVTAVDNWAVVFDLARTWFHLPQDVECIVADASMFVRSTNQRWDAVAVDVFLGDAIPTTLLSSEIANYLVRSLTPGGVIVWNVADVATSRTVQRISKTFDPLGFESLPISVLGFEVGNTIVVSRARPGHRAVS